MIDGAALLEILAEGVAGRSLEPGTPEWREAQEDYHALGERLCSACRKILPEGDFGPHPGGRFGLRSTCEPCRGRDGSHRYDGPEREGFVYSLLAADGTVLYVGQTVSLQARFWGFRQSHSRSKPWWPEVVSVRVRRYATETEAKAAEKWVIREEEPVHNRYRPEPEGRGRPDPISVDVRRLARGAFVT